MHEITIWNGIEETIPFVLVEIDCLILLFFPSQSKMALGLLKSIALQNKQTN